MSKMDLITILLSTLIVVATILYISITFDIANMTFERLLSVGKQILTGVSIASQLILCTILSIMIILQKSDNGPFQRSLNPLMYKADNVALHNNTKWFVMAITFNSLFLQFIC